LAAVVAGMGIAADTQCSLEVAQRSREARFRQCLEIQSGARQCFGQHRHRGFELPLPAQLPGTDQACVGLPTLGRQDLADFLQQGDLLHPAARKSVQRQHRADDLIVGQQLAPALVFDRFLGGWPRATGLVEEDDDRFADPLENRQLGFQVTGVGRLFRGIDQIEDDVGLVADIAHRLLREPHRAITKTIPDLPDEPADGVALLAQSLREAGAVAKSGRIPER
jgi:hypothetical protein